MPKTKSIHFEVPIETFEEFFRVFPGKGERAFFLRRMIDMSILLKKEKDCFIRKIIALAREEI